jgi:hypothetical protein
MFPESIDWSQLGIGLVAGYVISWGYFFITLPLFMKIFGKINGSLVNYGMSWIVWVVATYIIHQIIPDDIPINF